MKPYYQSNGIAIYCGDCLEVMPELDGPIDAIICDPPYGTTACSWDTVIPFEPLWAEYKRLIKKQGAVVLFGSQPFTSKLVMSNLDWFKYEWVWEKEQGKNFQLVNYRPQKLTENILIFSKGTPTYYPQNLKSVDIEKSNNGKSGNLNHLSSESKRSIYTQTKSNYPKDILYFQSDRGLHPTQKSEALLQYLIRTYTNPGDIVLDNTMGSGTTLVAAKAEKRRAIGIELKEEYCEIAAKRLEGYTPKEIKNNIDITNKVLF